MTKRHKIELSDMLQKHKQEIGTLTEFMRYSLGKRAPKTQDDTATPRTILDDDTTDIAAVQEAEKSSADISGADSFRTYVDQFKMKNMFEHKKS